MGGLGAVVSEGNRHISTVTGDELRVPGVPDDARRGASVATVRAAS
jgi:hypothetical protein